MEWLYANSDLNPIKLLWVDLKQTVNNYIKRHKTTRANISLNHTLKILSNVIIPHLKYYGECDNHCISMLAHIVSVSMLHLVYSTNVPKYSFTPSMTVDLLKLLNGSLGFYTVWNVSVLLLLLKKKKKS